MARSAFAFVLLLLVAFASTVRAAPRVGDVVLRADFEEADALSKWRVDGPGHAQIVSAGGSKSMLVQTRGKASQLARLALPVDRIQGTRVTVSGRVRGQDVEKPPQTYNGVKLMLHTTGPSGDTYAGVSELYYSFDWRDVSYTAVVPADAKEAWIIVGVEATGGTAWFDDVGISVSAVQRRRPAVQPTPLPTEKLDRRTDIPRLRGVMYGPKGREEDLRVLASWKANLVRWQFYWYDGSFPEKRRDLANYDRWLEETMAEVDRLLPACEELGIKVVIDLHTPPGAGKAGEWLMFQEKAYQEKFIEAWDKLVRRYKDQPAVWGYDLLNEPFEGKVGEGLMGWRELAEHVAKRVRAIDPQRAIIVEPGPHGGWDNLPFFEPIDVPGIIYSVHVYDPLRFTHQGIFDGQPIGVSYPGEIDGKRWDKDAIRANLELVRQYQLDYNVPIYVGEFSAPRWAPGDSAANYLRDCIDVFEEYGWDWSYHAFREWHAWNVELGPNPDDQTPAGGPTSRQKALMDGFLRKP